MCIHAWPSVFIVFVYICAIREICVPLRERTNKREHLPSLVLLFVGGMIYHWRVTFCKKRQEKLCFRLFFFAISE